MEATRLFRYHREKLSSNFYGVVMVHLGATHFYVVIVAILHSLIKRVALEILQHLKIVKQKRNYKVLDEDFNLVKD